MNSRYRRLRTALLAGAAAALVLCTSALAGSGVGGIFNLGQTNTVNSSTALTGSTPGAELRAVNSSGIGLLGQSGSATGFGLSGINTGGGPGLQSWVTSSAVAPLKVNSTHVVPNLHAANSDLLGGKAPSAYWQLGGNASGATAVFGTTDNNSLELDVNGARALRLEPDSTSPNVIAGSAGNRVLDGADGAAIAGGGEQTAPMQNTVTDDFGTIGGGTRNTAGNNDADPTTAEYSTVSGGTGNSAAATYATVSGGQNNAADGGWDTVVGGVDNTANGGRALIAGGESNLAGGTRAADVGGYSNTAAGTNGFIGGGASNSTGGTDAAVVGGSNNISAATDSFAAGTHATATQDGSFVWGDDSAGTTSITAPGVNTFVARAANGFWFGKNSSPYTPEQAGTAQLIGTSSGAYLTDGGTWTNSSDRARKRDFRSLNKQVVLRKLARIPIGSWSYKAEPASIRHVGPMAQDFYSAFRLGGDNTHITTIDEGGVALAAIQGLYRQNLALQRRLRRLHGEVSALKRH